MGNKKKIMILGGGYYQMPLIKAAVKYGYEAIVCGVKGDYPGYKYATRWYDVDTFDRDACLKIAKEENIDGVLTTGTDQMLPTLGYIVDKLGLYGSGLQPTILASNKSEMKAAFAREQVRTAVYNKVTTLNECLDFAKKHLYPVVLKVVDSSGSRGIAIVHNDEELKKEYPLVWKETKQTYIIIEEFVKGEEFGAQAYVKNGKLTMVMPHGDITYHGVTDVPVGHYAPYEHTSELIDDITDQLYRCIRALGINNTAINADFILCKGKVYVLEIGARPGATCLPELVSCHYDMDYYEYLLRMCVGEEMEFPKEYKYASWVETIQTQKGGEVISLQVPQMPADVVDFCLYPKVGDTVRPFRNAYDRIGTLVMKGDSLAELKSQRDEIVEGIVIDVR